MQEQFGNRDEIEIDLLELAHVLLRKWWMLVASFLVGVVILGVYTKLLVTPQYSASSTIYILSSSTNLTTEGFNLSLSEKLTEDFLLLAKSRPVLQEAADTLGDGMTYEELGKCVRVENPADSHMLKVIAEHPDPELAKDIANTMADVVAARVAKVMGVTKPNLMESAIAPKEPVSPSLMKNILLGGILGFFLTAAVIVLLYIMDDTIKNEEDVKKYLQLDTLAAFPEIRKKKRKSID